MWAKRVLDVAGALVLGLATLPMVAVLALLIRRDGGPVLFDQFRIGEGGRPFRLLKLRTMRQGVESGAQWAQPDDPRVTRIGRFLRRTDPTELPQLVNVLRGDMSLVGPRPEQPGFVVRLEKSLPFYQRRHLVRPGITGWGQIRSGYSTLGLRVGGQAVPRPLLPGAPVVRAGSRDPPRDAARAAASTLTATFAVRGEEREAPGPSIWHGVASPAYDPAVPGHRRLSASGMTRPAGRAAGPGPRRVRDGPLPA